MASPGSGWPRALTVHRHLHRRQNHGRAVEAVSINGKHHLEVVNYNFTTDFLANTSSYTSCSIEEIQEKVLLFDPEAPVRLFIYFLGSLIAFVLVLPMIVLDMRGRSTRWVMWEFLIYAIGAVSGIMTLAVGVVVGNTSPISWDDTCGVVHVMMDSDWGYWDVDIEMKFLRIVRAIFNI